MKLDTLTREQIQQVRIWRNAESQFLRTSYLITEGMQDKFFDEVINNPDSKHRYFAITEEGRFTAYQDRKGGVYEQDFIGMGGLTNIEWENGTAEISLIINPEYRKQGKGKEAVKLLLTQAFEKMRLYSVYGEVYECGNIKFWRNIMQEYAHYQTKLVNRKYYNERMYDSLWFSFEIGGIDDMYNTSKRW